MKLPHKNKRNKRRVKSRRQAARKRKRYLKRLPKIKEMIKRLYRKRIINRAAVRWEYELSRLQETHNSDYEDLNE